MSSGKRVVSALWVVGFLQCGCGDSRDPMDGSQEPPAPWVRAPDADGHGDAGSGHPDAGRSKAAGAQRDAGVMATARDAGAPDGSPDAGTVVVAAAPCGAAEDCKDADPCTRNERCDPVHALCQWDMLDNDKDGHVPVSCGGDDFDDANAVAFPG